MDQEYVLNPADEDFFIYSIDNIDSNVPLILSKGPYYESLEAIPFRRILQEKEQERRNREYEQQMAKREQSQIVSRTMIPPNQLYPETLPESYFTIQPRQASPPLSREGSPIMRNNLLPPIPASAYLGSPRGEFGPGDFETSKNTPDQLYVRQWKINRAIPLDNRAYYRISDESCMDLARQMDVNDLNFIDQQGEIFFCFPSNVLQEYIGLYRLNRPFTRITRQVTIQSRDAAGLPVEIKELYAGNVLVGTFEAPRQVKGIPGQFSSLPNDLKLKIMENLEPLDLITVCNLNINNRRLCQDPVRSVWRKKLQLLEPNLDFRRVRDPFYYFMRQYFGGVLLTLGDNRFDQLGRDVQQKKTFSNYMEMIGGDIHQPENYERLRPEVVEDDSDVDMNPKPISTKVEDFENTRRYSLRNEPELTQITSVACGTSFTIVVTVTGEAYGFGSNDQGQLGAEISRSFKIPNQIARQHGFVTAVACGESHSALLLRNGQVLTFGSNNFGKLGHGVNSESLRRNPVSPGSPDFRRSPDDMRRSPSPRYGGYQDVTEEFRSVPTPELVEEVRDAVAIACGGEHTAILLRNGQVVTFGNNDEGQLGRETPEREYRGSYIGRGRTTARFDATPKPADDIVTGFQISCGHTHTVVILADGRVVSFGSNEMGQLGRVTPDDPENHYDRTMLSDRVPTLIPEFRTAIGVACGYQHTAVVLQDGRVATFGSNERGQLARSIHRRDVTPKVIDGVSSAVQVSCGLASTVILLKNGNVLIGGEVVSTYRNLPNYKLKTVRKVNTAIAVAAGGAHLAILVMSRAW